MERNRAAERNRARSAVKTEVRKHNDATSWLFVSSTFLMLMSLIPMWNHWTEIAASLGFYAAACAVAAVTGAALIVSWWLNTGNE